LKSYNQRITEIYRSRVSIIWKGNWCQSSWLSVYRKFTEEKLNFQWQYFVTFTIGSWFLWN